MEAEKITALEAELRTWKEKAGELESQKAELESREIRLGKRVMKEIEEKEGMSKSVIEAERREHASEVLKFKSQIESLKAAEVSAKAKLSHVETVEVKRLEAKIESIDTELKLAKNGYTDLQERLQQDTAEKNTELAKALEEKRFANTEKITAISSKEVMEKRLQHLMESVTSHEGSLQEMKEMSKKLKKETSERESSLRREVRQLKSATRSFENEIATLKKQHEVSKEEATQAEDKVQRLKIKLQEMGIAHAKDTEAMEKERRFAENEVERMRLFAQRLEEGKTDTEIVKRLLGDSCHLDETALQKLATAQRLVADELDLNMTNAYSKWLEMRQRLQATESENSRLIDNHAATVEACETMAPAIFNQHRECQQLIKQQYKLQSSNTQLSKSYYEAQSALCAERKKSTESEKQVKILEEQLKEIQGQLRKWVQEPIETENKTKEATSRADLVHKRNVELEEKNATLRARIKHDTDRGTREREIEERAREKVEAIKQEFDYVCNEKALFSEQLEDVRQQRDKVFKLLSDYASVSSDVDLQTKLGDAQKEGGFSVGDVSSEVGTTLGALQSALNAEALQCKPIQVGELKTKVTDLELKLQNATEKLEDVTSRYTEAEAALLRENDYKEELHCKLQECIEVSTKRAEDEVKKQEEVTELHRERETALLELRSLKSSVVQEQEIRGLAEQDMAHLKAVNQNLEKLYSQAVEDNKIMNGFAVEVQQMVDQVRDVQSGEVESKNKLMEEQLKKINQLEELRREERQDWLGAENRLKLRLREAKTQQYAAEDECRRNESVAIKLKHELETAKKVTEHLESRTEFLQNHLKKVLTLGAERADESVMQANTIETLNKEVAMLKDIKAALESKYEAGTAEWEEAKSERETLRSYNKELANRVEELENVQKNAREIASTNQKQLQDKLDKTVEDLSETTQQLKNAKAEVEKQAKLVVICESEKVALIQEIESLNHKVTSTKQTLDAAYTERNKGHIELGSVMEDAKRWKEENIELKKKVAEAAAQISTNQAVDKTAVTAAQREIEEYKKEVALLREDAATKEQIFEKLSEVIISAGEAAVPKGDAQVATLKQLLSNKKLELQRLTNEVRSLQQNVRPICTVMDNEKVNLMEIRRLFNEKIELLNKTNTALRTELSRSEEKEKLLQDEIKELKEHMAEITKEKSRAETDKRKSDLKVSEVARDIGLIEDARIQLRERTKVEKQMTKLQEQSRENQVVVQALQLELSEKDKEIDERTKKEEELVQQLDKLAADQQKVTKLETIVLSQQKAIEDQTKAQAEAKAAAEEQTRAAAEAQARAAAAEAQAAEIQAQADARAAVEAHAQAEARVAAEAQAQAEARAAAEAQAQAQAEAKALNAAKAEEQAQAEAAKAQDAAKAKAEEQAKAVKAQAETVTKAQAEETQAKQEQDKATAVAAAEAKQEQVQQGKRMRDEQETNEDAKKRKLEGGEIEEEAEELPVTATMEVEAPCEEAEEIDAYAQEMSADPEACELEAEAVEEAEQVEVTDAPEEGEDAEVQDIVPQDTQATISTTLDASQESMEPFASEENLQKPGLDEADVPVLSESQEAMEEPVQEGEAAKATEAETEPVIEAVETEPPAEDEAETEVQPEQIATDAGTEALPTEQEAVPEPAATEKQETGTSGISPLATPFAPKPAPKTAFTAVANPFSQARANPFGAAPPSAASTSSAPSNLKRSLGESKEEKKKPRWAEGWSDTKTSAEGVPSHNRAAVGPPGSRGMPNVATETTEQVVFQSPTDSTPASPTPSPVPTKDKNEELVQLRAQLAALQAKQTQPASE